MEGGRVGRRKREAGEREEGGGDRTHSHTHL